MSEHHHRPLTWLDRTRRRRIMYAPYNPQRAGTAQPARRFSKQGVAGRDAKALAA